MNTTRTLIAGAAAMLLAAPAVAQQDDPMTQPGQSASQSQSRGAQGQSGQAMQRDPQMVRQIQQKLQDQGFEVGEVDGKWGPKTANALKEFQRQQGMEATGKLSQRTVSALGVSMDGDSMATGQGQPGGADAAAGSTDSMGTGDAQGATGATDSTNRGAGGTGAGTTGTGTGAGSPGGGAGGAAGAGGGAGR